MAVHVAESLKSTIMLNDGVKMPLFGLGVWRCEPGGETEKTVSFALGKGYKLIDTAAFYGNEEDVGKAVKNCGLNREDVFVISKLWKTNHGYEQAKKAFLESFKKLGLEYIDLYLIHSPKGDKLVDTYQALLEMKEKGLVRSVGVSNFGIQHIEGLRDAGKPLPSVNQIELHVWQRKPEIVQYCRDNGIAVMGYAPLGKGKRMEDPTVMKISENNKKSYAQTLIRWSVQNGFITIPKSAKTERITENSEVFDWTLSEEDMKTLNGLPDWNCCWNPTVDPWKG